MNLKFWTRAAIIAAIYVAITVIFAPISYGLMQVRISEALCILPFLTPSAIPGLFIGCLIANIFGGVGIIDIVFGSLATLISAYLTYRIKNKWLAPIPAVVVNAFVVGAILYYIGLAPFWICVCWVAAGQAIACYALGLPLLLLLEKYKDRIFS